MYMGGAPLFMGGFFFVIWLGLLIYFVLLANRLVSAVERIANHLDTQSK